MRSYHPPTSVCTPTLAASDCHLTIGSTTSGQNRASSCLHRCMKQSERRGTRARLLPRPPPRDKLAVRRARVAQVFRRDAAVVQEPEELRALVPARVARSALPEATPRGLSDRWWQPHHGTVRSVRLLMSSTGGSRLRRIPRRSSMETKSAPARLPMASLMPGINVMTKLSKPTASNLALCWFRTSTADLMVSRLSPAMPASSSPSFVKAKIAARCIVPAGLSKPMRRDKASPRRAGFLKFAVSVSQMPGWQTASSTTK